MTTAYRDQLAEYFASRRWFAGKGREFEVSHVQPVSWLAGDDPMVRVEVVTVTFADGQTDTYQFPVAYLTDEDPSMGHALVGRLDDPELGAVVAYDAVYFKAAADSLLEGFRGPDVGDDIAFHVVEGAELPSPGAAGMVMTGEQSNTSIAFAEEGILKLFRRLSAGGNPDIEIHEALTKKDSEHVAPLLGWITGRWSDPDGTVHEGDLGMLQVFLRTATDGWTMALSSVRDLLVEQDLHPDEVGGDFAGESTRLGVATGEVHADLAELFGTAVSDADDVAALVAAMNARLDAAIDIVPDLAEHADALRRRYSALATRERLSVQRVHGDFHLGQTLRTVKGWKILDFEGEPAKPLAERLAFDSPLRDVAGMLRSFDYAAGSTLREFGANDQLRYRAGEWASRNRAAFLDGYGEATGVDHTEVADVIAAYETDKAVYEAVYETRNRPSWLAIPLTAIARLATEE